MKRFLLLQFLIVFIACTGQQPAKQQQAVTDTAKLFDPYPQPEDVGGGQEASGMFNRGIVLFKPGFSFLLNKQEHTLKTEEDVKRFIAGNKEEMKKSKVYILTDSNTAFSKIISTIDLLKEQQVTDYKVINIDKYFAPEPPLVITTPKSVTTRPLDSPDNYFSISLQKNKITVTLAGKPQELKDVAALDQFITGNKSSIDTKKILIVQDAETKFESYKLLIEVLKKHSYYKFIMVTQ